MPARLMADSVTATARVRVNLDMHGSDRSTDGIWMADGRLADAWPAGQLPPPTGQPAPPAAVRPTGAMGEPGPGALLM
jgi:hypothetical protein